MTNKELIEHYPFLQIRDFFTNEPAPEWEEFTMLDDMPQGWRDSFGIEMCEEIKELLIKEKFGELRWYGSYISPEFSEILNKYIKLSRTTCIDCGQTAKYVNTPWIYPVCDRCSKAIDSSRLRSIEEYWGDWDE